MPRLARLVAGGALLVTLACASVPPAATPAASPAALTPDRRLAFEQLRVRQALDLLAQSVPPDHRLRMAPYLALVRAALQDVP